MRKTARSAGPAAQAAFAEKAANGKGANATTSTALDLIEANHVATKSPVGGEHADRSVCAPGAPPGWSGTHLLGKRQVLAITNVTFPTIWAWMRAGTFPRARVVGGQSMWLSTEIEAWLAGLPVRKLKGDCEKPAGAELSGSCLRGSAS